MSSSDSPSITIDVAVQKSVLSDQLNSTLLFCFLMGIYTTISITTIYLYAHRKQSRSIIVTCALLILTTTSIANAALQWKQLNICFVDNGQSMLSAFACSLTQPQTALTVPIIIIPDLQSIISDSLLVWRCYHLSDKSLRAIKFPVLFLSLEIVIGVVIMTVDGILILRNPTETFSEIAQIINIVFYSMTAFTTISSTVFICQRIARSINQTQDTQRYFKIMTFAIESSVIYSVASVLNIIDEIISISSSNLLLGIAFDSYVSATTLIMTVLAPILMIAQISLSSSNPGSTIVENTPPISTLQFNHEEMESPSTATHNSITSARGINGMGKEQA